MIVIAIIFYKNNYGHSHNINDDDKLGESRKRFASLSRAKTEQNCPSVLYYRR